MTVTGYEHAERFTLLRPLLFTIAYEILGSATESDDVLQESYLRWAEVDLDTVNDTKAYLAQLVTRQSLNFLRAQSRRREDYIGPWLPEPLLLEPKDASADVVLAESVSMAMLVVLETLSPEERAVFVLHEVFGFTHEEIASTIGKSASATRQLAHRARQHVQARRKRFEPVDPDLSLEITAKFFTAASTGDVDGLLEMLAPDVVWTADSDGKATAARRPVTGAGQDREAGRRHGPRHRGDRACRTRDVQQRPCAQALPGRALRGPDHRRDHRWPDQPLLRDAQSGQTDRRRHPTGDQPRSLTS